MNPRFTTRRAVALAAGVFLVGSLLVTPAEALLIRHSDGSLSNGCGVVAQYENPTRLARLATRVPLPRSYLSASGRFRIHYTTDPTDKSAVSPTDANDNGVADWVETVAHVADSVMNNYERLGYLINLSDNGAGGGPEYDIYITDLSSEGVYGYTWPGRDAHLQIDNDYTNSIYETKGAAGLRVTLAHELFHAVQFTYYIGGLDAIWWQEATAVFMEEVNYPQLNDYIQYLNPNYFCDTMFEDPSISLYYRGSAACDVHMYGAAVFCHFLDQSDPERGQEAIRYTFERERDLNSGDRAVIIRAIETKMKQPIRDLLASFWMWSYFSGDRSRPNLFFSDRTLYAYPPPSKIAQSEWVVENLAQKKTAHGTAEAAGLGAWLYRFVPDGSPGGFRLALSAPNSPPNTWAWLVAVADRDTVRTYRPVDNTILVPNWDHADDVILVAANGSLQDGKQAFSFTATYDKKLTRLAPEPLVLRLFPNRPNPFNPTTTIPFSISAPSTVAAVVYDVNGRVVRSLFPPTEYGSGDHLIEWDGLTDEGTRAGAGVYLLHLVAGSVSRSERMTLLR